MKVLGGIAGRRQADTKISLVGDRAGHDSPAQDAAADCQAARQQVALATRTRSTSRQHTRSTPGKDMG
jgi:hypothetical protein